MNLNDLSPAPGSVHVGKRKGRGHGTGNGKTAGRGHKGQKARSGGGVRIGFEGGQMPLARRIPKRGFNNIFAKPLEAINVSKLEVFDDGETVNAQLLLERGILSKCTYGVKILGTGEITKKLTVQASAFSKSAAEKIEAAGGKAEVVQLLKTIRNAWKLPDLRKKIIFTALILLIYRVGNAVPVPYIDASLLSSYFTSLENTVLGLYNAMSGGAFASATIFALSIQPYINSSIIIQLLTVAIPALERMAKEEGEVGKKKMERITRYTTIGLGLLMGWAYYMLISRNNLLSQEGLWPALVIILTFAAGSTFIMWLGEQINEFGIGNGISIILMASIVSRLPHTLTSLYTYTRNFFLPDVADTATVYSPWGTGLILLGILAIIVFIVFISDSERRLPVSYAKRVVGRKMYGGQSTHLPMKLNMSGVMPVIFAQSIASLPATVAAFFPTPAEGTFWSGFLSAIDTKSILYIVIYFLLIIGFSYFYASIQFNPIEVANNLRKSGGFIPGFRPGRPTADFIKKVLNKVTMFGAIYLGVVAIMPILAGKAVNTSGLAIGGTSLIIVVGVALDTVKQLENQMLMRHYKGFLEQENTYA